MSRVQQAADRRRMARPIGEFVTRGYKLPSNSETSARSKGRNWGDPGVRPILAALTGRWTLALSNALHAVYEHATAEAVVVPPVEGLDE